MGQFRLLAWTGLAIIAGAALWHNVPTLAPGMFDWAEPGNVAAALVHGRGFSDPFDGGTGPTAWVSPVPAWIEAAVFLVCGAKTAASARVMLALVVLGLAGANALLVRALAPFGTRMAPAASCVFLAFCILIPGGSLVVLSEAWLDVLLSAALLWAVLEVLRAPGRAASVTLIAVAFIAPLENAGLAAAAALCVLALAWKSRGTPKALALPASAAAAAVIAVACWTARNAAVLGRPIPLKSNSWFELHLANVDSADGLPRMETILRRLPYFDTGEFKRYSELGEVRYVDSFRASALAAVRADPLHFAGNVLRRLCLAVAFERREGGGASTQHTFLPVDTARLSAAGELIVMGAAGNLWARIDAPVEPELAKLRGLGLEDPSGAVADWAAKRLIFDAQNRGLAAIALGFLTAGFPVAALLCAALLGGGRLSAPGAWAALIAFGMLLPYVLVNHNERHQASIIAMQAVAVGALAQALADRRERPRAAA
jgi:hypothetical protein